MRKRLVSLEYRLLRKGEAPWLKPKSVIKLAASMRKEVSYKLPSPDLPNMYTPSTVDSLLGVSSQRVLGFAI